MYCLIYSSHDDWPSSDEFPRRLYWIAHYLPAGDYYVVETGFSSYAAKARIAELVEIDRANAKQSD